MAVLFDPDNDDMRECANFIQPFFMNTRECSEAGGNVPRVRAVLLALCSLFALIVAKILIDLSRYLFSHVVDDVGLVDRASVVARRVHSDEVARAAVQL